MHFSRAIDSTKHSLSALLLRFDEVQAVSLVTLGIRRSLRGVADLSTL